MLVVQHTPKTALTVPPPASCGAGSAAGAEERSPTEAGAAAAPRRRLSAPAPERLADMLGLAGAVNRELMSSRRFGSKPALLLIAVEARSPGASQAPAAPATAALMQALGARLRSRVRASDVVLQVGEPRFAVILQNMERADLQALQTRLLHALAGPYELDGELLFAGLRMGACKCTQLRCSGLELSQAAEAALLQAGPDLPWSPAEARRQLDLPPAVPRARFSLSAPQG